MKNESTVYIYFASPITQKSTNDIMRICMQAVISKPRPTCLHFLIATPGGEVASGIHLYYFLKSLPVKIIMSSLGNIDSIGTIIFLAGEERNSPKNASFLFHGVKGTLGQVDHKGVKEVQSSFEQSEQKIAGIISEATEITRDEIVSFFLQGETKDADYALSKGLIHRIEEVVLPYDCRMVFIGSA